MNINRMFHNRSSITNAVHIDITTITIAITITITIAITITNTVTATIPVTVTNKMNVYRLLGTKLVVLLQVELVRTNPTSLCMTPHQRATLRSYIGFRV